MTPARILIADDHEVVREGVKSLLEQQPGWTVCGEASTGREAFVKAVDLRPDVVILDASMPEMNGLEAARQIREMLPAKILILTMHDSEQLLTESLDAGAQGYVLKSDAGKTLVDAIRAVINGGIFVKGIEATAPSRKRSGYESGARRKSASLTPREREVLQLLAESKSNKEIGTLLGITTKTAETHRAHIMAKLNIHSIAELVRYAIRNHITVV
jgi:DNA-binding NarL/FixJ family response regulator